MLNVDTSKMEAIYQNIGIKISQIIPDKWTKVYLYAEVLNDSREVFF